MSETMIEFRNEAERKRWLKVYNDAIEAGHEPQEAARRAINDRDILRCVPGHLLALGPHLAHGGKGEP